MQPFWGIDLGGTKIEGVIIKSVEQPEVILRLRIPTEAGSGYHHILQRIKLLVDNLSRESGLSPQSIGMGTPGTLDPVSQTIKNSNTTVLNGKPLQKDISELLGVPVVLANDANCFALAETRLGIVREVMPEAETVFGVIMGTGVGGGVVVHGKILNGRHGIGGEWGHNFLDQQGGQCYCGKTGCVETLLCGPAQEKHYFDLTGKRLSLQEIIQRHLQARDPDATLVVERLLQYFGKAVAVVINILDPDVIVLGGGLGNIGLLYDEGVKEIKKHVFNPELNTIFARPKLGDSAGVFGAAMLTA